MKKFSNSSDEKKVTSSSDCPVDDTAEGGPPVNPNFTSSETNGIHTTSNGIGPEGLIFEQCTESGFMPDSVANMLFHESFDALPEGELEDNDAEDHDSTISELSGLSDLSNISGQDWKPMSGPMSWVHRQMTSGIDPRLILSELLPKGSFIPQNVNDGMLWRFIVNLLSEPKRAKLTHINTLDDVTQLLRTCKNIIVLTGAGVSVSCGIPDFRSRNGIYARLSKDYPDLPDPQAMFDIHYFRKDPRPFFKFAKEIYPGQFAPSPSHKFIRLLERQNKLLRNYTQNIDTLEHAAGIANVITCHGSFATATCTLCGYKVDSSVIKEDIFNQQIPYCPICPSDLEERGIMKPDIVFFGEGLSDEFHDAMARDKEVCDLLIVMGSSLKVRPVAMIPSSIPTDIPQILINREPLKHLTFDIELLGDCDVIIGEICRRLSKDWSIEEDIPQSTLQEIPIRPEQRESPSLDAALLEINNNMNASALDMGPSSSLQGGEESNSCDCRGLSAINLEDNEDASNPEKSAATGREEEKVTTLHDKNIWPTNSRESISKRIPAGSYLYFAPSRCIFEGAEVYKDDGHGVDDDDDDEEEDEDEHSSTPTDYSSDFGSPNRHSSVDANDLSGDAVSLPPPSSSAEPSQNKEISPEKRGDT